MWRNLVLVRAEWNQEAPALQRRQSGSPDQPEQKPGSHQKRVLFVEEIIIIIVVAVVE